MSKTLNHKGVISLSYLFNKKNSSMNLTYNIISISHPISSEARSTLIPYTSTFNHFAQLGKNSF